MKAPANSDNRSLFPPRLALAMPLVFFVGTAVVLATGVIFYVSHPEYMARTLPSISKTGAEPPGDVLFTAGISFVALCSIVTWSLVYVLNRDRVRALRPLLAGDTHLRVLNATAYALGIAAGVFLALLANITLEDDGDVHEIYSIIFFATQVLAFIVDTTAVRLLAAHARNLGVPGGNLYLPEGFDFKALLCVLVVADALLFLGMFIEREIELFANRRLMLEIYTFAEYSVSILCFGYAASYYRQVRDYLEDRQRLALSAPRRRG